VELAAVGVVEPDGVAVVRPASVVEIDEAVIGVLTPSYQAISAAATGSPTESASDAGLLGWLTSSPSAVAVFS